eukprot:TRINITY_DN22312_c0_g1_i1.p2 TRINITY_DN22312_c0_g1~~TRINITY_DN22312_c0_g1_i1.p2  ORF type:complete len:119 (-),score=28.19 TRINITY_DN22312_c0_g1_i1:18-374(-)
MSAHRRKSEDRAYNARMQAETHRGVLWVSPERTSSSQGGGGGGHYNNSDGNHHPSAQATNAAGQLIAEFARDDDDGGYDQNQHVAVKTAVDGALSDRSSSHPVPVSYTHLTLPTKRIV